MLDAHTNVGGGLTASVVGLGCVCASRIPTPEKINSKILCFLRKKQQKHEEHFYKTLAAQQVEGAG